MTADSTVLTPQEIAATEYKIEVKDAASRKVVGTYRPNKHNAQFSIVLESGFYIFDFYVNGTKKQTLEYTIDDREPLRNNLTIDILLKGND